MGWYWSRRYSHLGDPAVVPSALEDGCEPGGRSHDDLCGNMRRPVPDLSHGSRMDGVLHASLSQHTWSPLAELQFSAVVGRIRDLDILHGLSALLVCQGGDILGANTFGHDGTFVAEDNQ